MYRTRFMCKTLCKMRNLVCPITCTVFINLSVTLSNSASISLRMFTVLYWCALAHVYMCVSAGELWTLIKEKKARIFVCGYYLSCVCSNMTFMPVPWLGPWTEYCPLFAVPPVWVDRSRRPWQPLLKSRANCRATPRRRSSKSLWTTANTSRNCGVSVARKSY